MLFRINLNNFAYKSILMDNFKINNKDESIEIDLFGDIGESWFGESISMDFVKNMLNENKNKNITLNISSLGGDVTHAFVIHDLFKTHKGIVTANIIGATASSGTIIALGADNVRMSENSLFLVHNVWTMAVGNAEHLEKQAEDLRKYDDVVINIYQKKTGQERQAIEDLMKEEKWISADEAFHFGFVDEVYEPMKAAASVKQIPENNFNIPKINMNLFNKKEKTVLNKIVINEIEAIYSGDLKDGIELACIGDVQLESGDYEIDSRMYTIENNIITKIEEIREPMYNLEQVNSKVNDAIATKDVEIEGLNSKLTEFEKIKADFEAKILALESENKELKEIKSTHKVPQKDTDDHFVTKTYDDIMAEIQAKVNEKK